MEMGGKIYNLRIQKGLTLEELGKLVGVGKSTVRKWEKGMIANMKRDKIANLASALDTTPAYLMGWQDEESQAIAKRFNEQCKLKGLSIKDVSSKANVDLQYVKNLSLGIAPTEGREELGDIASAIGMSYFRLMGWVSREEEEFQEAIQLAAASDNAEESLSLLGADYLEVYKLYASLNDIGKRKALDNLRDLAQIYSSSPTRSNVVELPREDRQDRDYLHVQAAHHDTIEESDELEKTKRDLTGLKRPNK